jgi:hypothetical protein
MVNVSSKVCRLGNATSIQLDPASSPRSARHQEEAAAEAEGVAVGNSQGARSEVDVDAAVQEFYGLPPEEFTAARNELARATKAAGDTDASRQVKALRKPTLAAWLANQLVRAEPARVASLSQLGDDLCSAHQSRDGARLRQLTPRRHGLVQDLVKVARARAQSTGHRITDTVGDRLTETLDAALVDPGAAQLLRSGRLTSALRHVGFGVVDEAGEPAQVISITTARTARAGRERVPVEPAKPEPSKAEQRALARRREELQGRVEEAEAEFAGLEAERAQAEAELDANEHHTEDMRLAIERLTEELEKARRELRTAQGQTGRLERALTRASRSAAVAASRCDAARQRLANLND